MYIKHIELKDFRNYNNLNLTFDPNTNLLLGNNAQGKTNLLESIYITSLGKSFRTSKDKELIKFDCDFCRVKLTACKTGDDLVIDIVITQEGKKGIKINGVKAKKNSALLENIYIVIFSPEDLKIIKEEPEKRRKFIDRELCQIKPSYFNNLANYKKVLLQRNAYLKEESVDLSVLDIWDTKLSEFGSKVMLQRNEFITKLAAISKKIHGEITNYKELLALFYESSVPLERSLENQIQVFYETLKKHNSSDLRLRTTGKGPHKDDIKVTSNKIDIRKFGSQGQQRTAALSLKLSEIQLIKEETGENPVLLLDDVLSELDHNRQKFLLQFFEEIQVFITTAELSEEIKKSLCNGKIYIIDDGQVKDRFK